MGSGATPPDSAGDLVARERLEEPVFVTRPTLPPLDRYHELLADIWESKWLTNNGPFHQRFESEIASYLGVEHVSLFCNGTLALLVALQALRVTSGEVITTPFTFPATVHVLHWNGVTPVFCDIDPYTFNLDPLAIESLITPRTMAVLPVHVFGLPCDVNAIQDIADRHGLKVLYDGAHAFGVQSPQGPLAGRGDVTMLSFHATKLFTSVEGGALVCGSDRLKRRVDFLKNFGIADEETVVGPGVNGKMNELQSAFGLLHLEMIEREIEQRARIDSLYRSLLQGIPGIRLPAIPPGIRRNHSHFPVLVDPERFGVGRDRLHEILKQCNVFTRKYFHPLCSQLPSYRSLPSAQRDRLPVAGQVSSRVLCLPMYGTLEERTAARICEIVAEIHGRALRGTLQA